jgi:tight adherence protein C
MFEPFSLSLNLSFSGLVFGPVETVLLVVGLATALVSLFELFRLSGRDRLQQRVASLRGTILDRTEIRRAPPMQWYHRLGSVIAHSPLVGIAEQQRLATKLAIAGIGGPGRVATLIALRVSFAVVGTFLVWSAMSAIELPPKAAIMQYVALPFGLIIGWRIPDIVLDRLVRRRKMRLEVGFPDALDLLVICAEAGLSLDQAIGQVARDMRMATPEVAEEFAITEAEMRVIADRRIPLEHLAERTGLDSLHGMIAILNQSVRFGTPLSEALRQLAAEARMIRMARLEEQAGRLSVQLLLPIMGFILPCLFVVVCGPIMLRAIDMFKNFLGSP